MTAHQIDASRHVVFIDSAVAGHAALLLAVPAFARVFTLDTGRDGIAQISAQLETRRDLDALHIIAHGAPGALALGSAELNAGTLENDYAEQIGRWSSAFAAGADILIYGCDVAATRAGEVFVERLADLTGAGIAAATGRIGSALLGGSWSLPFSTGAVTTQPIDGSRTDFAGVLSHYRASGLSWESVSGNTVAFHMQVSFRWSYPAWSSFIQPGSPINPMPGANPVVVGTILNLGSGSNALFFGDGTSAAFRIKVIAIDTQQDLLVGELVDASGNTLTHTYASAGDREMSWGDQTRISTLQEGFADQPWRTETIVNVGSTNHAPISSLAPIIQVADNTIVQFQIPAIDPDGDTLTYRLGRADEFISATGAPFAPGTLVAPSGIEIDASTGVVTWDIRNAVLPSVDPNEVYAMTVMVEDGHTKTPLDFIIRVIDTTTNQAPVFSFVPADTTVFVGTPLDFALTAPDPNGSDVNIQVLNPPTGLSAAFHPDHDELHVHFAPIAAQAGQSFVVNFRAIDATGLATNASVTFTVELTNTAPVVQTNTGTTVENGGVTTIPTIGLEVVDAEQNHALLTFSLPSLPQHGQLLRDGVAVAPGGTFTQKDIDDGLISYQHDGSETVSDSFLFDVSDGLGGSTGQASFAIAVEPGDYLWSAANDGDVYAFDPNADRLHFDVASISAAEVKVAAGSVILSDGLKTVTLLTEIATITEANVFFDDGSVLLVGDNGVGTAGDDGPNTLTGGAGDDHLIGLGGNDALNGGDGFDFAGYSTAAAGVVASLTSPGTNTGEAAGDTYTSIEGLIGSNFGDTLVGDGGVNEIQGLDGNDSLFGFADNDTLRGGGNDDFLTGGTGADTHDGGAGFDYARYDSAATGVTVDLSGVVAGTGDAGGDTFTGIEGVIGSAFGDTVSGDGLANTLQGRNGNDVLAGAAGDDNLQGGNNDDTLDGGDDNDLLFGQDGNDVMTGGSGNDTLDGGAGADSHDGGSGFDFVRYSAAAAGITASLTAPGTNTGEAAGDTYASIEGLLGTNFGDTLVGNGVANEVQGLFGNDFLYGFADNDTLRGGNDNDSLTGGAGADAQDGGAGFDYARYDTAAGGVTVDLSVVVANTGDAAGDAFVSIEGLVGSGFGDHLYGDGIANILQGRNGNDILGGGAGNDNLQGGNDSDTVLGGAGRDSMYGEAGTDTLQGGDENDSLYGGSGADSLDGGAGALDYARYDTATTGVTVDLSGVVIATGDAAGDTFTSIEAIVGTSFADAVYGDGLANTLQGRNGNDTLEGRAGNDILLGGLDNDILRGDAGNDSLYGEDGIDTLEGGADNDGLYGGAGADILDGGAGTADYARYDTAAAGVTVDLSMVVAGTGDAAGDTFIAIEGIVGSGLGDTIYGNALNNTLQGRNGNDTLDGRLGIDMLIGGTGSDTFKFVLGQANGDTVADFAGNGASAGDTLVFQGYGPGATFVQTNATTWQINYTGGSELLHFTNAAAIHSSDYSFV